VDFFKIDGSLFFYLIEFFVECGFVLFESFFGFIVLLLDHVSFGGIFLSGEVDGLFGFEFDFSDFLFVNIADSIELILKLVAFIGDVLVLLSQESSLFFVVDFKFHELIIFVKNFLFVVFNVCEVF
jgi:hypothetical protein